ncbi:hypothetical protein [Microbispora bryophytorum]|uniref:hypothetical protein n=1 Tax=Microbispora bryophytorum TaxID=1460882 RepID=UPI0033C93B6A
MSAAGGATRYRYSPIALAKTSAAEASAARVTWALTRSVMDGGWISTFTDPRPCAAIADRLAFNATIIETGADFYRLAHTRAQQVDAPA